MSKIDVRSHVGKPVNTGLLVLTLSFVDPDPERKFGSDTV